MLMQGQENCTDIIYPTDGKSIIFNCCIDEVKDGNIVYFVKDGKRHIVESIAINKGGRYIELKVESHQPIEVIPEAEPVTGLYKGHDYNYYNEKYMKANGQKRFGVIFTLLGTGLAVGGVVILANEANKYVYNESNVVVGALMYVNGIILFNIGVPLWISGGIKKTNNRRAMEATKRSMNLSLGTTNNGAGLIVRF